MKKITTITRSIPIEYSLDKEGIICSNAPTLQHLWGATISSSSLVNWNGVIRLERGEYLIPNKVFIERLEHLENRYKRTGETLILLRELKNMLTKKVRGN